MDGLGEPDVRDARMLGSLPRRAANRSGSSTSERNKLHSTKLNQSRDLKSFLLSGMKMQCLEFAQLVFRLALFQYFLTMTPSLHSGMLLYILCHYMLEVCDMFLFLFYTDYIYETMNLRRDYKLCTLKYF